jgi:UDP-2,4-diacetamido-2,4,6-trideoxy-beta-L-altropyranose hydrolase
MAEHADQSRPLLTIYTEASPAIGAGHVVRCSAYAAEWQRLGGRAQWVLDGDPDFAARFLPEGSDFRFADWTTGIGRDLATSAIAIVDSYRVDQAVFNDAAACSGQTVAIDDLSLIPYSSGFAVRGSPGPVVIPDGDRAEWLVGPKWQPLRPAFARLSKRQVARDIHTIAVLMGGSDVRGLAERTAAIVREVYPYASIAIVGRVAGDALPPGTTARHDLTAEEISAVLSSADVAVSAAGQTTFELAACGTPSVLVGVADNQRHHLKYWPQTGANVAAGMWDDPDLGDKLASQLQKLATPSVRQEMARAGQAQVDGLGARRLFERLAHVSA